MLCWGMSYQTGNTLQWLLSHSSGRGVSYQVISPFHHVNQGTHWFGLLQIMGKHSHSATCLCTVPLGWMASNEWRPSPMLMCSAGDTRNFQVGSNHRWHHIGDWVAGWDSSRSFPFGSLFSSPHFKLITWWRGKGSSVSEVHPSSENKSGQHSLDLSKDISYSIANVGKMSDCNNPYREAKDGSFAL